MKVRICECPRDLCRYRWIPRVGNPKECPNCKHRFFADWGLPLKCSEVVIRSKAELQKLRDDIQKWNEKRRWETE